MLHFREEQEKKEKKHKKMMKTINLECIDRIRFASISHTNQLASTKRDKQLNTIEH